MKKCCSFFGLVAFLFCPVFFAVNADAAADGKAIFTSACAKCHGMDGSSGKAPALKGKKADAVVMMLEGYKSGSYGGEKKEVMEEVARKYSSEEFKAVGDYLGALGGM